MARATKAQQIEAENEAQALAFFKQALFWLRELSRQLGEASVAGVQPGLVRLVPRRIVIGRARHRADRGVDRRVFARQSSRCLEHGRQAHRHMVAPTALVRSPRRPPVNTHGRMGPPHCA